MQPITDIGTIYFLFFWAFVGIIFTTILGIKIMIKAIKDMAEDAVEKRLDERSKRD